MTVLADSIKSWCEQESLAITVERDEETAFVAAISLPGEPALSVGVRASGAHPARVLLSRSFELAVPPEMAGDAQTGSRIAEMVERVAASRSALLECSQSIREGKTAIEVTVTLHEDGMSKQGLLTALEEIRKVGRVVEWELEAMAQTAGLMSEVRSGLGAIVERTEALASETAEAVQEFEAPVAAPEAAPSAAESAPTPAPPPQPAAAPAAGVFCTECGRQARAGARFCAGCGSPLES